MVSKSDSKEMTYDLEFKDAIPNEGIRIGLVPVCRSDDWVLDAPGERSGQATECEESVHPHVPASSSNISQLVL